MQQQPSYLTARITGLTTSVIQELNNPNKHTIRDYESILQNPIAAACVKLKALRATISLGEYQHKNKDIQKFILNNIENMQGSLADIVGRLCSAMPFGFSCGEIAFYPHKTLRRTEWRLQGINILDPKRVRFAGHYGDITHVKYNNGIREIWLPYNRAIHITNGLVTNYNERTAYGDPECEVAYPFVKLYSLILSEMAVSAKTLATGILVGLADSDNTVYLYDKYGKVMTDPSTGQPYMMNAVQHLGEQLKNLENHSHIVTDKKNQVTALSVPAGEQFWNLALQLLKNDIMLSFVTPAMVFSEGSGSLNMASLGARQISILDATVEAIVKQIRDQLIEKVIRPLIQWNFGTQETYGEFVVTSSSDPNQESLLLQNMITAFSMNLVPQTDVLAINVLREKLKLPPLTLEQINQMQLLNTAMQTQQATMQQDPAQAQQILAGLNGADNSGMSESTYP